MGIPFQSSVVLCVTLPKYVHDKESVSVSTLRSYAGDHVAPRVMYLTCMERTHMHTHARTSRRHTKPDAGTCTQIINAARQRKHTRVRVGVGDDCSVVYHELRGGQPQHQPPGWNGVQLFTDIRDPSSAKRIARLPINAPATAAPHSRGAASCDLWLGAIEGDRSMAFAYGL